MFSRKATLLYKSAWNACRTISSVSKATPVGIVGVGVVGTSVANNLLRDGYTVSGYFDINPEAGKRLTKPITSYSSPKVLAENSEIIITALPAPPDVKAAVLGSNGVLAGLKAGGIWIDHSTTDYQQTLDLAAEAKAKNVGFLEAPVTGGVTLLKKGQMTVLVGGDEELYKECMPILKQSGANVLYLGKQGSATITKVISNMLASTHNVATGEACMLAKRAGVDLKPFFDAIRFSAGNSYVFETEAPLIFNGTYDPDFTLGLQCKDMNLGYEISRRFGVPMEVHALVEQIYNRARLQYGDESPSSMPPKLTEEALGEPLQTEGFEDWTYTVENVKGSLVVIHQKKGNSENTA